MATVEFQTPDLTSLQGKLDTPTVLDSGPAPSNIIRRGEPWSVKVDWTITGTMAPVLGGEWEVKALIESMGPGLEMEVQHDIVAVAKVPAGFTRAYSTTLQVPGTTVTSDGIYRLVVAVLHRNQNQPTRIAGFAEGPLIQVYTAA